MFGIGMPELIVILVLALIILGPKKLPDLAKSLGKGLAEFRKATNELKESINVDEDLSEVKQTVADAVTEVRKIETLASQELKDWEKAAIEQEKKEIERKLAEGDAPSDEPASTDMDDAITDSEGWPYPYAATGDEERTSSSEFSKEVAPDTSSDTAAEEKTPGGDRSPDVTDDKKNASDPAETSTSPPEHTHSSPDREKAPSVPSEDSSK